MDIVFLHGYGANKEDLMPLERVLRSNEDQKFHFLDAAHLIQPTHFGGRSWFEINDYEMMKLQMGNLDFSKSKPNDLDEALGYIKNELDKRGIKQCILGGFSQGSMCAIHFYLKYFKDFEFKGVVLYSSTLLAEELVNEFTGPKIPVYQSHGRDDSILKYEYAKNLEKSLVSLGFPHQFHEFSGGHEIPLEVLMKSREFIEKVS